MLMDFSLLGFINEFLNFENHLFLFKFVIPLSFWNGNFPITFHRVFVFLLRILKRCMSRLKNIILYWFLPYISVVFISQKERKIDKKFVAIIDAICFVVLFFFAYNYANSFIHLPLSYYEMYDWCNDYLITLRILGLIGSFLYSICFNYRLLKKYIKGLSIQKYEKLFFWVFVILFIIVSYLFLFIHLTYLR